MFRRDTFSSRVKVVEDCPTAVDSLSIKQLLDKPEEQAGFTDLCERLALELASTISLRQTQIRKDRYNVQKVPYFTKGRVFDRC